MNSDTLRLVDPEIQKAVKTVVDETTPPGKVAMQMDDGAVKHFEVADWQAIIKAGMDAQKEQDAGLRAQAIARGQRRKRERVNRRNGRRQSRRK